MPDAARDTLPFPAQPAALLRDQRQRWQRGERVRVETYLEQQPSLRADAEMLLDLIYNEFILREQQGEAPRPEEYLERFPELTEQLRLQFEMDRAVQAGGWLSSAERPTARLVPAADTATASAELPVLPGYQVLELIGRGGMGVVYKARQLGLNRLVALKMIRAGDDGDPAPLARFRAEAEAVARLQHPNIVQIHEIGEWRPAGAGSPRPFLALEYVEGGSLDKALLGKPQPAPQAAELVETLARAMHAAHQQGIVHRDLKPANILLSGGRKLPEGTSGGLRPPLSSPPLAECLPKITDFGLAKRLDVNLGQTRTGEVMGTPSYMAPEQALGRNPTVGPATDVYALGAILYELLTGRPPFQGESPLDTLQQAVAHEPVAPRALQPKVPRDLETICLKCLQKEPGRRYGSALQLAEDLRCFRENRPIAARPVGRTERLWRWCKRSPAVAGLLVGLIVAILAGFAAVTHQWLTARRERAVAQQERDRAEEGFQTARRAVDERFTRATDDPLPRQIQERLAGAYPTIADYQNELASSLDGLGQLHKAAGRPDEALRWHERARDIWQKLADGDSADTRFPGDLAICLDSIALLHQQAGRPDEALRLYQQARTALQRLIEVDAADAMYQWELGKNLLHVGFLKQNHNQSAEALQSFDEARQILEALVRTDPDNPKYGRDLASSLEGVARQHSQAGRHDQAVKSAEAARDIRVRLANRHPADVELLTDLASVHNNISIVYKAAGQRDQELDAFRQAEAAWKKAADQRPERRDLQKQLARARYNLGAMERGAGRREEALQAFEEARSGWAKLVEADSQDLGSLLGLADSLRFIGSLQEQLGRRADALAALEEARQWYEPAVALSGKQVDARLGLARVYSQLGLVHSNAKQTEAAVQSFDQGRELLQKLVEEYRERPDLRAELAQTCGNLGILYREQKRPGEALAAFEQAVEQQRAAVALAPKEARYRNGLLGCYDRLGKVQREMGRPAAAVATARERRKLAPNDSGQLYAAGREMALCVALVSKSGTDLTTEEKAERERYAAEAVEVLRQAVGVGFKDVQRLKTDAALEPLRSRDDFRKLLAEAEKKAGSEGR